MFREIPPVSTPLTEPSEPRTARPPLTPPDPVEQVRATAERVQQLRTDERVLAFQRSDDGVLRIDVYDGEGRLVRSIPPNEKLAKAMGATTWQA